MRENAIFIAKIDLIRDIECKNEIKMSCYKFIKNKKFVIFCKFF